MREENGKTVQGFTGKYVVADVVAKLSKVSLSQVRKVMAAQTALAANTGVDASELIEYDDTPLTLPDETRAQNTQRVYESLILDGEISEDIRKEIRL